MGKFFSTHSERIEILRSRNIDIPNASDHENPTLYLGEDD